MSDVIYYIIYDKNDFPLFVGTAKECSSYLNTTIGSFWSAVTRARKGIRKGNKSYMVYKIDDVGEYEDE